MAIREENICRTQEGLSDKTKEELVLIKLGQEEKLATEAVKELKRRKLAEERHKNLYIIRKGANFREKKGKINTELTSAMLAEGKWRNLEFKDFNPNSQGLTVDNGNLHPLMKTKQQFTEVLT